MYRDPSLLRSHVVKLRFSKEEDRLLEALADYTGEQKAVLVRELVLERARALMRAECEADGLAAECAARVPGRV
jgi:predicted DNA-binding protein